MYGLYVVIISLFVSTDLSDTGYKLNPHSKSSLKAKIKGTPRILQTKRWPQRTSFTLPETKDGEFLMCLIY